MESQFALTRASGALLAAALALALQRIAPHTRLRASWQVNVSLSGLNVVVLGLVCSACGLTVAAWTATARIGLLNRLTVPMWLSVAATILALDFVSYGWHRANHQVSLLWRLHGVHHSDPSFTVSTGVRFHPGELLLSLPVRLAAVAALGAPVMGVLLFEVVFTAATLVEHGNIDLPRALERRLARLVVTPALHRRHHTCRRPELDTNFGTILTMWDRLLGTYLDNTSAARVETGLPGLRGDVGFMRALALPLRDAPRRA